MPKVVITETDLTGASSLPAADNTIYIPGLMKAGASATPATLYSAKYSLKRAAETVQYDTGCLSFRLATYIQDVLGMRVVYEGLAAESTKVPDTSWKYLADNRDRLPVRFLTTGQFFDGSVDENAIKCAMKRGDCTALLCLDEEKLSAPSTTEPYQYKLLTSETAPADFDDPADPAKYFKKGYVALDPADMPEWEPHKYYVLIDTAYYCLVDEPEDWSDPQTTYYEVEYEAVDGDAYVKDTFYEGIYVVNVPVDAIIAKFDEAITEDIKGEYAAAFTPAFITKIKALCADGQSEETIPAVFGFIFAYARMVQNNPEYLATAGSERGVIPELDHVLFDFSDADSEKLQGHNSVPEIDFDNLDDLVDGSIAINPILEQYPFGTIIWGASTLRRYHAEEGLKALAFLNVRNFVSTIKKVARGAARKFTFDQNSDTLWYNVKSLIEPTLEAAKNGNGIAGYRMTRYTTEKKARLVGKIKIVPIEPVTDFDLEVILADSIAVTE